MKLPCGAVLKEEVDVIGCLGEINELDYVGVMNRLPCLDLVFEGVDEVLLCERLIFRKINLVDEVLLLNHLAGQHLPSL